MVKKIKYIIITFVLSLLILLVTNIKSDAASTSVSINSKEVNVGDTVTVTVSVNAAQWKLELTANGKSINSWIETVNYESNLSKKFTTSYKASSKGIVNFELKGDITDFDQTNTEINKSVSLTVKEKASSGGSSGGSSETNKPTEEKPEEKVTFSSVNETVYAKTSANVRSSYSTNSNIIGGLNKGQSVTRTGIGDNGWSRINYNGSTAYVSSDLLTKTKPKVEENDDKDKNKEDNKDKEDEKSTNKNLSSLKVTPSTLNPKFNVDTTQYTMTVGENIDKLNIEAIAEDKKAKVEITGNENLKLGDNIIKIAVTAEDGTIRTYIITVTKEETVQLGLSELLIEGMTLTPEFSTGVYEYTVSSDNKELKELNITAKPSEKDAKIEIIGNSNFKEGENVITILVSKGEETVTYQIKLDIKNASIVEKTEENNNIIYYVGGAILAVILLIIIIVVVKKRKSETRNEEDDNFTYYSQIKTNTQESKEDVKEELDNKINDNNTENFKFEDDETPKKKKGKHF